MTSEPDLLPSSVAAFTEALKGARGSLDAWLEVNDEREVAAHVEAYARANVAVATATLQAEVEALRAEVEAWRELSDHVRVGACKAIWPDRYTDERTRDVAAALKRAERLREALEEVRSRSCMNLAMNPNPYELTALLGDIHQIAGAALAQEADRE